MTEINKFKKYVSERGAIILDPTSEWEVLRFRTQNGVSVVYKNKNGRLTYTGESIDAWAAFTSNKFSWRAVDVKRKNLKDKKIKLANRDGKRCFYHGEKMDFDQLTIEHLLNKSHGGNDHESNLCLSCADCNTIVGNWPLTKKMLWRDTKINKTEAQVVSQTAATIFQLFDERFANLNRVKLLSPIAPKIELRHIVNAMGAEV